MPDPTEAVHTLRAALPDNPEHDGPVGVDAAALRQVLETLDRAIVPTPVGDYMTLAAVIHDWSSHSSERYVHQPGMDDPVVQHPGLYTTRQRFDRVDDALISIQRQLDRVGARSTAAADVDAAVYEALMSATLDPKRAEGPYGARLLHAECTTLAARITRALYGDGTELTPVASAPDTEGAAQPEGDRQ